MGSSPEKKNGELWDRFGERRKETTAGFLRALVLSAAIHTSIFGILEWKKNGDEVAHWIETQKRALIGVLDDRSEETAAFEAKYEEILEAGKPFDYGEFFIEDEYVRGKVGEGQALNAKGVSKGTIDYFMSYMEDHSFFELLETLMAMTGEQIDGSSFLTDLLNREDKKGNCKARMKFFLSVLSVVRPRGVFKVQQLSDHVRLLVQVGDAFYALEKKGPLHVLPEDLDNTVIMDPRVYIKMALGQDYFKDIDIYSNDGNLGKPKDFDSDDALEVKVDRSKLRAMSTDRWEKPHSKAPIEVRFLGKDDLEKEKQDVDTEDKEEVKDERWILTKDDIVRAKLTGNLSLLGYKVDDLSVLKELKNLKFLDLGSVKVEDWSPLEDLVKLKTLKLDRSNIVDLEPLRGLVNLEELNLRRTDLKDLEPLRGLKNLTYLDLYETSIEDLSPLSELKALRSLLLTKKVKDFSVFKGLENLRRLSLFTTIDDGADLSPLHGLKKLRDLSLPGVKAKDIGFVANMKELEYLYIVGDDIKDLSFLRDLLKLERLVVSDSIPLSSENIEIFKKMNERGGYADLVGKGGVKRWSSK